MEARERPTKDYETETGEKPYLDWLKTVTDKKVKARIVLGVRKMSVGNFGDSKSVGGGVVELRLHFGPGYRIYYTVENDEIVLLLLGGDKSTQSQDIQLAQGYLEDYRSRQNG